ncbi:MAG TPA: RsmD family RNA methyltransferase [Ignavibacteria bacterium]|nr:RsmD family RNA methyltransferase [Ignavibacteria bacterium]
MRIISGIYGRRILKSPSKGTVRPTTDRAKETLFNILSNKIDFNGLIVADLFCGSGSLGLECLSRGADEIYFTDINIANVESNIKSLGIKSGVKLINSNVLSFLKKHTDVKFDLIFADPPYNYEQYEELINQVSKCCCYFILEHESKISLPENFSEFIETEKKTGITKFTIYNFSK